MREILHAWRESGRNSDQAGDSLSMRESWKPCFKCTDFIMQSNKEDNFFVSFCFCNLQLPVSLETTDNSVGSVVKNSFENDVDNQSEN